MINPQIMIISVMVLL